MLNNTKNFLNKLDFVKNDSFLEFPNSYLLMKISSPCREKLSFGIPRFVFLASFNLKDSFCLHFSRGSLAFKKTIKLPTAFFTYVSK